MQEIAYDVHFWWMPYAISIRWQVKESHISVTPESRTKANAMNVCMCERVRMCVWVSVFGLYFILIRNDERDTDKVYSPPLSNLPYLIIYNAIHHQQQRRRQWQHHHHQMRWMRCKKAQALNRQPSMQLKETAAEMRRDATEQWYLLFMDIKWVHHKICVQCSKFILLAFCAQWWDNFRLNVFAHVHQYTRTSIPWRRWRRKRERKRAARARTRTHMNSWINTNTHIENKKKTLIQLWCERIEWAANCKFCSMIAHIIGNIKHP